MRKLLVLACICIVGFSACVYSGSELAYYVTLPDKNPPGLRQTVRASVYIDTSRPIEEVRDILRSVARYSILPHRNTTGQPVAFFDYVILSGGFMKWGEVSAYMEVSPELMRILAEDNELLRPLRAQGTKVLLGVTGGNDGVAFGSPMGEGRIKNRVTFVQIAFARRVVDFCKFYNFEGVEFWDKDGEGQGRNPYPHVGTDFYNGERIFRINDEFESALHWEIGGSNMIDVFSHVLELFGAAASEQGDLDHTQKIRTPILVRETLFGRNIPTMVPRYEFASSISCITYLINNSSTEFGYGNSGIANPDMSFVPDRSYGPVILDLAALQDAALQEFAVKLGRARDSSGEHTVVGESEYGLLYFTNLRAHSAAQLEKLSIVSREVYGADVRYE